jgi:hypothetical protein
MWTRVMRRAERRSRRSTFIHVEGLIGSGALRAPAYDAQRRPATIFRMCAQCMAGAATAAAAASGIRAYVAARRPSWLTPARLRRASGALIAVAVVGAGVVA